MSDRGILFLFSLLVVIVSLGASVWLLANGQAGTVDGLFLLLTCLITAAAFGLYLMFVVHRTREALEAAAKAAAKPPAKPAVAQKPVPAASTSSQPV
jgi:hypothetical protein